MEDRIILGLTEDVYIIDNDHNKKVRARIDTGAITSSIDKSLVSDLNLGPYVKTTTVVSSQGRVERPSLFIKVNVKGKELRIRFTVADRSHMKFPMLVGQNILKKGFLIDPNKN